MKAEARANTNFTALGGEDIHASQDRRYRHYRDEWEGRPKRQEPGTFPVHLDIESTSRCNLRCTFCDRRLQLDSGDQGDMDFGLFKAIIDEGAAQGLLSAKLNFRGEPLLHPRLPEMVAYAKSRGLVDVYCNTNAMLLTEAKARDLIEAGLDRISVSVEGSDPVVYEAARIGAKFDVVRRNIKGLRTLRDRLGAMCPKIRLQTVRLPGIDVNEYARYWGGLADETAVLDFTDPNPAGPEPVEAPGWACPQPWQRMTVEWNGAVHLCHNDDREMMLVGRFPETTLAACWTSEQSDRVRRLHAAGESHLVPGCARCNWRAAQVALQDCKNARPPRLTITSETGKSKRGKQ